jgi:hypothetical protein
MNHRDISDIHHIQGCGNSVIGVNHLIKTLTQHVTSNLDILDLEQNTVAITMHARSDAASRHALQHAPHTTDRGAGARRAGTPAFNFSLRLSKRRAASH